MEVKSIWTEMDFEEMGWHDSYIHAIALPSESLELVLDIDYLFKWVLDDETNSYNFWVSPCTLYFFNVLNLKIDVDFQDSVGLDISEIKRINPRPSKNGKTTLWDFEIETNKGVIKFESSGFKQIVRKQPAYSPSQVLERIKW